MNTCLQNNRLFVTKKVCSKILNLMESEEMEFKKLWCENIHIKK